MSTRTIIAIMILLGAYIAITYDRKEAAISTPQPVVCTQEAKQCPDGSYVGRTGPQCQFADCPTDVPSPNPGPVVTPPVIVLGTVKGRVTLSPGCGIQADPPIPGCDHRPYETTISFNSSVSKPYKATSNADGYYSIKLLPGTYSVQAQGGQLYPSCPVETVIIVNNQTVTKNLDCESGIR